MRSHGGGRGGMSHGGSRKGRSIDEEMVEEENRMRGHGGMSRGGHGGKMGGHRG